MRLLIGMPDPASLGGPAACEPPFVAELRRVGMSVEEETYVYGDKLSPTRLHERVRRVLRTALTLRRKLKAGSFDVLHLNTSFDTRALLRDVITLAIIGRRRTRIFLKFHGSNADLLRTGNPILRLIVRRILKSADGIGLLSTEERQNFVNAGHDERKIFVIANVVQPNSAETNGHFNSLFDLPSGLPILLFIARFIAAKGLLDVIRACGVLRERGIDCALLCVGDGPARVESELEASKLGLGECVRFSGFVPEEQTADFYANCTMLVFPTYHYEGFPMSVFYAARAGLPIITTRIRAAADYLSEPENCFWVEPKNPTMLADKIESLLTNIEARQQMRVANKRLARQFTAELVTPRYVDVYRQLIASGNQPSTPALSQQE